MKYGYSRCSTNAEKQDINRQIRELKAAGAEEVIVEWEHGDAKIKPQLALLLERVQEGDILMTTEVSRLARSTKQLCDIVDKIKEKKMCLCVLGSITIDCRDGRIDPTSNAFIQMAGVFAELELMIIRERVKSGMANSKEKGIKLGRPKVSKENIPSIFYKHYPSYKKGDLSITDLARVCQLSRTTVYKYISLVEKDKAV